MRTISADNLAAIWPEAVVVDVRSAEEYATARIAGGITGWYRNGHPVTCAPPPAEHPEPARRRPLAAALTRIFQRTSR